MNTLNTSHIAIEKEFAVLAAGETGAWGSLGLLLIKIEESRYWNQTAGSFTEWMKNHAKDFNLKESSLWRYLTAAQYYKTLQLKLTSPDGNELSLAERLNKMSPENLELLSKLERVVPPDIFMNLSSKVFSSTATRSFLRETWRAYRPALEGRTARGSGSAPQVDMNDMKQSASVEHAKIFTTLAKSIAVFSEKKDPLAYKIFMNIRPDFNEREESFEFDAVGVVQEDADSPLTFHGIDIRTDDISGSIPLFRKQCQYCDYQWLALPEHYLNFDADLIPKTIGVIVLTEDGFKVIRRSIINQCATRTGALAKGLLLTLISR